MYVFEVRASLVISSEVYYVRNPFVLDVVGSSTKLSLWSDTGSSSPSIASAAEEWVTIANMIKRIVRSRERVTFIVQS
jgi:hypothetical protein